MSTVTSSKKSNISDDALGNNSWKIMSRSKSSRDVETNQLVSDPPLKQPPNRIFIFYLYHFFSILNDERVQSEE